MIPRSVYWPCMLPKKYVDAIFSFFHVFTVHQAVTHCSQGQLEGVAELLWGPLFENSQNAEETTRNVAAACLGKLATIAPSRYLPELHVTTSRCSTLRLITDILSLGSCPRSKRRHSGHCSLCYPLYVCRHFTIIRRTSLSSPRRLLITHGG